MSNASYAMNNKGPAKPLEAIPQRTAVPARTDQEMFISRIELISFLSLFKNYFVAKSRSYFTIFKKRGKKHHDTSLRTVSFNTNDTFAQFMTTQEE